MSEHNAGASTAEPVEPSSEGGSFPPPTRPTIQRLYRSRQERMVAGVCGGLGQYFNLDPVIFRLAFVLLAFGGFGVLLYLIFVIVVPDRPLGEPEPVISGTLDSGRGREILALILVAVGLLVLASNLRIFSMPDWGQLWPILLIIAGGFLLMNRTAER